MSRSFLTGINLNKNELLNARIQNLATAPSSPVAGQIYYNTDDNTLRYYNGTSWLTLAQGGDLAGAIEAAIDALTTDDIEEGSTNLYYSDSLVDSHLSAGTAITYNEGQISVGINSGGGIAESGGALSVDRITVDTWYDASGAASTAQTNAQNYADQLASNYDAAGAAAAAETAANGYTDTAIGALTTDDIEEGSTNLYFSDAAAVSAVEVVLGTGLTTFGGEIIVDQDVIASKTYVDNAVSGLAWKEAVNLFATANVALTGTHGTLVIDGHSALDSGDAGYRLLLTAQSTATQNGIYVYSSVNTTDYELVRATDADAVAELVGAAVFVMEGTTYGGTSWVQNDHYANSFDDLVWSQFSGGGTITAGNGIAVDGLEVSADLDTLSGLSLGSGGLSVNINSVGGLAKDGLTGALYVATTTGITKDGLTGALKIDTSSGYGVRKYAASNPELTPTDGVVTWEVTHNLTNDVTIQMFDKNTGATVEADVVRTSTTVATLSWVAASTVSATSYRVVVIG